MINLSKHFTYSNKEHALYTKRAANQRNSMYGNHHICRCLRERKRMSREAVATVSGISTTTLRDYEWGKQTTDLVAGKIVSYWYGKIKPVQAPATPVEAKVEQKDTNVPEQAQKPVEVLVPTPKPVKELEHYENDSDGWHTRPPHKDYGKDWQVRMADKYKRFVLKYNGTETGKGQVKLVKLNPDDTTKHCWITTKRGKDCSNEVKDVKDVKKLEWYTRIRYSRRTHFIYVNDAKKPVPEIKLQYDPSINIADRIVAVTADGHVVQDMYGNFHFSKYVKMWNWIWNQNPDKNHIGDSGWRFVNNMTRKHGVGIHVGDFDVIQISVRTGFMKRSKHYDIPIGKKNRDW